MLAGAADDRSVLTSATLLVKGVKNSLFKDVATSSYNFFVASTAAVWYDVLMILQVAGVNLKAIWMI